MKNEEITERMLSCAEEVESLRYHLWPALVVFGAVVGLLLYGIWILTGRA